MDKSRLVDANWASDIKNRGFLLGYFDFALRIKTIRFR